jgi:hypothetical protein
MAQTASKPLPIPVGFQWQHPASGKQWVVTGIRPGGVCEVHQVGRLVTGERYIRDIRASIDAGAAIPMETTDEARAILRRCNG